MSTGASTPRPSHCAQQAVVSWPLAGTSAARPLRKRDWRLLTRPQPCDCVGEPLWEREEYRRQSSMRDRTTPATEAPRTLEQGSPSVYPALPPHARRIAALFTEECLVR